MLPDNNKSNKYKGENNMANFFDTAAVNIKQGNHKGLTGRTKEAAQATIKANDDERRIDFTKNKRGEK